MNPDSPSPPAPAPVPAPLCGVKPALRALYPPPAANGQRLEQLLTKLR